MSQNKPPMDSRCPRSLKNHPGSWCPLGVLRLKAIRNAGRELTEEEEAALPGCPWAINHQLANYCFFQYAEEYTESENISDIEIAGLLCISSDTVKKTEKIAISKMKDFPAIKEVKTSLDNGESVLGDKISQEDLAIYI
jgi:hypothetical protein